MATALIVVPQWLHHRLPQAPAAAHPEQEARRVRRRLKRLRRGAEDDAAGGSDDGDDDDVADGGGGGLKRRRKVAAEGVAGLHICIIGLGCHSGASPVLLTDVFFKKNGRSHSQGMGALGRQR